MKTVKTTTLCMALLGLAVLLVACNGGKAHEIKVSEHHNDAIPVSDRDTVRIPIMVSNYDTVIVGNFTGKGLDTLRIVPGKYQTIYTRLHTEGGTEVFDTNVNDEYINDEYFNYVEIYDTISDFCRKCTIVSSNKKIKDKQIDWVVGKPHIFLLGDLDGNGTDEWGCITYRRGSFRFVEGRDAAHEGDSYSIAWSSFESAVYEMRIFSLVKNQWRCFVADVFDGAIRYPYGDDPKSVMDLYADPRNAFETMSYGTVYDTIKINEKNWVSPADKKGYMKIRMRDDHWNYYGSSADFSCSDTIVKIVFK